MLLSKQMLRDEAKVYICSQSLVTSLLIVKLYNNHIKQIDPIRQNPFSLMNSINRNILEYLKSKYPRNKNLFVPVELEEKFDPINFITMHENNTLVNMNVTFSVRNSTRVETLDKTKKFLNSLMEEVNAHFGVFTSLLNDHAFYLK